ncbi:hypothetical protein Nepgr_007128 [Nepenthes gracilis]|uniref:Stigma-specific STIG1-like protein 1 n=1 Tax=Nepenthes gracilis TaxID=150966 RepID=A0AAD3S6H0_NEPGR|nr:hypothetical protein Nepgr_007128 [Nepenthes gracilis]
MKFSKFIFALIVLMALIFNTVSTIQAPDDVANDNQEISFEDNQDQVKLPQESSKLPIPPPRLIMSRFLAQKQKVLAQKQKEETRGTLTCNKYPRICHAKGSPGPDCCKKKCVDVKTDKLNCGMCGLKCKQPEICCKGNCVNPMHDKKHCGGCDNKCKKGRVCDYGMCSYA